MIDLQDKIITIIGASPSIGSFLNKSLLSANLKAVRAGSKPIKENIYQDNQRHN